MGRGVWELGEDEKTIARLEEQVRTLFSNDSRLEVAIKDLTGEIANLRKELATRLPFWATGSISLLTAMVGWLVKG